MKSPKPAPQAVGKPLAVDPYGRAVANWAFPFFMGMMLLGFFMIRAVGFPAGARSGVRALFFAINAATLTGFDQNPGVGGLDFAGQFIVLILMIVGSLFSMIVGGLAVSHIARLKFQPDQVIFGAVIAETLALLIGTPLLMTSDRTLFQAIFLSASAFGNCGLYVGSLPGAGGLLTHGLVLPLTILGGLGIPVLMDLTAAIFRRGTLSRHTRDVLSSSAWLYIAGVVLLTGLNWASSRETWSLETASQALRAGSILSVESRTGGMPIAEVHDLSQSAQWIIIVLMAIGASPAGTGGGLKTTTIVELVRGTRRLIEGEHPGRGFGVAVMWLGIYGAIVLGGAMLLSFIHPAATVGGTLLSAVSGASNVGFSLSGVPDAKNVLYAHCAIMLLGRMTPLMILWWIADTMPEVEAAIG
ncbi:MAG: hypothetical protein ABSF29_00425 [Tepidisphaeraceae bacterium]